MAAAVAVARPTRTVTVTVTPAPSGRLDHDTSVAPLSAATRGRRLAPSLDARQRSRVGRRAGPPGIDHVAAELGDRHRGEDRQGHDDEGEWNGLAAFVTPCIIATPCRAVDQAPAGAMEDATP